MTSLTRFAFWGVALCLLTNICLGATGKVTYEYDDAGRLKATAHHDGTKKSYDLDPAGNRIMVQTGLGNGVLQLTNTALSISESGTSVVFNVTRTGASTGAVAVSFTTSNGSALSGSDYTATSGTLNWASGDASTKSITIPIINDNTTESTETFTLTLSSPTGGAILDSNTQATITITDDDVVSFSIGNVSVNESTSTASFTVTKTGNTTGSNSINYATSNGTATAGSDFTASSGSVTFTSNETSKTIAIPIINDTVYEGNESFNLGISNATNGAIITTSTGVATIIDNETPPTFAISNVSINENTASTTFTVTKTGSTALSSSVQYATSNGTATAGADYTVTSGTLTFLAAETSKTFTVAILNDSVYEGTETFTVGLSSASGATISTATGTGTINDNDPMPVLSISSATVNENVGTISFTVTKTGATALNSSVNFTFGNGTASQGADFTGTNGTLDFTSNVSTQTITANIVDDSIYEGNETFTVTLSAASGVIIGAASATGTITENDPLPVFSVSNSTVNENAGTVNVTITKVGFTAFSSTVYFAIGGGTAQNTDYTASIDSGTLTFASDATSQTVTVTIIDDTMDEENETIGLGLYNATGATIGTGNATITIVDNDASDTISLANQSMSNQGESSAVSIYFMLKANGNIERVACTDAGCTYQVIGAWISPKLNMSYYQVRATNSSCYGAPPNQWKNIRQCEE